MPEREYPWVENEFYRQVRIGSARLAAEDERVERWVRVACRKRLEEHAN